MLIVLLQLGCIVDDVSTPGTYANIAGQSQGSGDTDTDTDADTDGDTSGEASDGLVGSWVSEDADLSALLAPYFSVVTADFAADGTYEVVAVDTGGKQYTFEGSYTTDTSTDPASIELVQTAPSPQRSVGIYAVDGAVLTYEVVQVEPSAGYTPPSPASGFGSSSGPSLSAGENVQTYRRL